MHMFIHTDTHIHTSQVYSVWGVGPVSRDCEIMHTYAPTYIHIHLHTYIYTYRYAHIHTCMHMFIPTDTHTYTPQVYFVWGVGPVSRDGVTMLRDPTFVGTPSFKSFEYTEKCQEKILQVFTIPGF